MAQGSYQPDYLESDTDDYGYVYQQDEADDESGSDQIQYQRQNFDDDSEPLESYRYIPSSDDEDEIDDGDIQINDQYWDDEYEEIWEEEYPESWIPYPAESTVKPDISPIDGSLISQTPPQNSQQVFIGASPGLYPNPSDINTHFCEIYPELCAERPHGRGIPIRNNSALYVNGNSSMGEAGVIDSQITKGLPVLKFVDFSGLGVALLLVLIVLLALNLGWDSEVSHLLLDLRCVIDGNQY